MINTYSDFVENASFYQIRTTVINQNATRLTLCKQDNTRRQLHIYLDPQGALATPNWIFIGGVPTQMYANYAGAMELNLDWYQHGLMVCSSFGVAAAAAAGTITVVESLMIPRQEREVSRDAGILKAIAAKIKTASRRS